MSHNTRTKNAMLNIAFGYIAQIGIFILSFAGRRIFLNYLSADYLGINGLYSNVLTILSLAELGLDTAVVYSLYKPVAENDTLLIRSLLFFFRKIYFILAFLIFVIGVAIIPFLDIIVNSDLQRKDLIIYYVVFLTNTVASYFVAHKVALLSACQEQRIHKLITLVATLLLQIVYICVLVLTRSYLAYIIAMLLVTIVTNLILSATCTKIHSDIFLDETTVSFEKKPIIERVKATFLYKFGAVLINSTDNILISVLVNTVAVGFYSNYYTVVNAVQGFIAIITTSLISGVGNYAVTKNKKGQKGLFYFVLLIYQIIAAIGFIGFSLLFNDLIAIWLGNEYLFDQATVFMISANFYLATAISPVWMFREANGLFDKVKYLLLVRAGLNIVFSILFGKLWGVFGIFFATAISLVATNLWYEPKILFNTILQEKTNNYWKKQGKYLILMVISFFACYLSVNGLGNGLVFLIVKAIIIVGITGGIFVITNIDTDEFARIKSLIKR